MKGLEIDPKRAVVLVVDIQERLAAVMPEEDRAACERNVGVLLEMARRMGMPVVVSEQYPKGLGPTTEKVKAALEGTGARWIQKVRFGCHEVPEFDEIYGELGRDQWIVTGMEAHVCVYQTARGLVEKGAAVHVPRDAVTSRTRDNREVGLRLLDRAGAIVTSTEVVVFDALKQAGTEDFKALSKLIK